MWNNIPVSTERSNRHWINQSLKQVPDCLGYSSPSGPTAHFEESQDVKINHIITKPTESLKNHLPQKDQSLNTVRVQTKDGIGELHIFREHQNEYFLSFYKVGKSTHHLELVWQSRAISSPNAVDTTWLACWNRPGGFLL